jgi:hypothetical protein
MKAAEKNAGARVARPHQHLGGRTVLGDLAAIHEKDMVGDVAREADLVGHHDGAKAARGAESGA